MPMEQVIPLPLDKKIQQFSSIPFIHKAFLHPKKFVSLGGIAFILIGLSNIFIFSGYRQLAIIIGSAGFLFDFAMCIWFFYPCRCGKEYNLTAYSKKVIRQHTRKTLLASILIGCIASLLLMFLLFPHINQLVPFCGGILTIIGFFYLLDGLTGNKISGLCRLSVPDERTQQITAIKGTNLDELTEIFNYHIDTGNYEEADHISKISLAIANEPTID